MNVILHNLWPIRRILAFHTVASQKKRNSHHMKLRDMQEHLKAEYRLDEGYLFILHHTPVRAFVSYEQSGAIWLFLRPQKGVLIRVSYTRSAAWARFMPLVRVINIWSHVFAWHHVSIVWLVIHNWTVSMSTYFMQVLPANCMIFFSFTGKFPRRWCAIVITD